MMFFPSNVFLECTNIDQTDVRSHDLQDWFVQRKSQTSWTCCTGETKACCEDEKTRGHAGKTMI